MKWIKASNKSNDVLVLPGKDVYIKWDNWSDRDVGGDRLIKELYENGWEDIYWLDESTPSSTERLFSLEEMKTAIRFGIDAANSFCGFPSELEDYIQEEEKYFFKKKFGIELPQ